MGVAYMCDIINYKNVMQRKFKDVMKPGTQPNPKDIKMCNKLAEWDNYGRLGIVNNQK